MVDVDSLYLEMAASARAAVARIDENTVLALLITGWDNIVRIEFPQALLDAPIKGLLGSTVTKLIEAWPNP